MPRSIPTPPRALRLAACAMLAAGCAADRAATAPRPSAPLLLRIVSGDVQSGEAGEPLPEPLRVQLMDDEGRPVAGHVVNFRVVVGGGAVFAGAAATDAQGHAAEWWTLGPASADTQRVEVRAVDPTTAERRVYATFRAVTPLPAPAVSLAVVPSTLTLAAGTAGSATVEVTRVGGFDGPVTLAALGAPADVTVTLPGVGASATSARATLSVSPGMARGTYPIVIRGTAPGIADATTTLALTVGPPPAPDVPGAMTAGLRHLGRIARAGQTDSWTFAATQGEYVALALGETGTTSADFTPWLRVVGPTGQALRSDWGAAAVQYGFNAPATGTYTVIVGSADSGTDGTGDYRLTLFRAPGVFTVAASDDGGAATNGGNHAGHVAVGDLDAWTVAASQGDYIALAIGEGAAATVSADFTPWIRVVGPTGQLLRSDWGAAAVEHGFNAPATGTYTVIVGTADSGVDGWGDYVLTAYKVPGPFVVAGGDHGGSASTTGASQTGHIARGDLDAWTFTATQGSTFVVSLGEGPAATVSADFTPWLRVVGPTGQLLRSDWGAAAVQYQRVAPSTGTYTVIVGTADSGSDGTGDYVLQVTVAGATIGLAPPPRP